MTETGMSEVLLHLIDTLQLGGQELFRIFTEVQFALSIQYAILVIGAIIGAILGIKYGITFSEWVIQKYDVDSYDAPIVKWIIPIIFLLGGILSVTLMIDAILGIYMHAMYPEYYAAKELINSLAYIS